jgi:hypothetical protein
LIPSTCRRIFLPCPELVRESCELFFMAMTPVRVEDVSSKV